ncbi:MAG: hypothetical protein EXS37_08965 [Opitutus sp.]|nr:hypothetical protein [Opitutus sp.]
MADPVDHETEDENAERERPETDTKDVALLGFAEIELSLPLADDLRADDKAECAGDERDEAAPEDPGRVRGGGGSTYGGWQCRWVNLGLVLTKISCPIAQWSRRRSTGGRARLHRWDEVKSLECAVAIVLYEILQALAQPRDNLRVLLVEVGALVGIALQIVELADRDVPQAIPAALVWNGKKLTDPGRRRLDPCATFANANDTRPRR